MLIFARDPSMHQANFFRLPTSSMLLTLRAVACRPVLAPETAETTPLSRLAAVLPLQAIALAYYLKRSIPVLF